MLFSLGSATRRLMILDRISGDARQGCTEEFSLIPYHQLEYLHEQVVVPSK